MKKNQLICYCPYCGNELEPSNFVDEDETFDGDKFMVYHCDLCNTTFTIGKGNYFKGECANR